MKVMTAEKLSAYKHLTEITDAWAELFWNLESQGYHEAAEHAKQRVIELCKDLDTIGDCNHRYTGINC